MPRTTRGAVMSEAWLLANTGAATRPPGLRRRCIWANCCAVMLMRRILPKDGSLQRKLFARGAARRLGIGERVASGIGANGVAAEVTRRNGFDGKIRLVTSAATTSWAGPAVGKNNRVKSLSLDAGDDTVFNLSGQRPFWFLFARQMKWNLFEVVAISAAPGAATGHLG